MICHSIILLSSYSLILFSHPIFSSYYHPIRSSFSEANRIRSESVFFFITLKKTTRFSPSRPPPVFFWSIILHTATRCNTLLHTATRYNTLQHTCNALQHTATHLHTLQHARIFCRPEGLCSLKTHGLVDPLCGTSWINVCMQNAIHNLWHKEGLQDLFWYNVLCSFVALWACVLCT